MSTGDRDVHAPRRRAGARTKPDPGRTGPDLAGLQHAAGNRAMGRLLGRDEPTTAAARDRPAVDAGTSTPAFMGAPPVPMLLAGPPSTQRDVLTEDKAKAPSKAKGADKKVNHATGKEVDAMASASSFLKPYVASKIKGGTKAEGAVTIHDAAAFKKAWVDYATVRENPDTSKTFTKAEAEAWEPRINAFQGDDKIHIHQSRGERGTAIHESMHLYASTDFINGLGFNVNEGTTEYMTRIVTADNKITRGTFYPKQLASVTKLVGVSSKQKLADAYFKNSLDGLKKDVDAKAAKDEKGSRWAVWVTNMKAGQYAKADKQLE